MSAITSLFTAVFAVLRNWWAGLSSLGRIVAWGAQAATGDGPGGVRGRLAAKMLAPEGMRAATAVMRAFVPNLLLARKLVASYENTGTAIVARREDVLEVLENNAAYEVVYEPRMEKITGGKNFFLGMQPGWDYTRDTSAMRLVARMDDVANIVLPRANEVAAAGVAAAGRVIDLPQDVGLKTSRDLVGHYFGLPGPSQDEMVEWTSTLFQYLFGDLGADPSTVAHAERVMPLFRDYVDGVIADRKSGNAEDRDDVLKRCLEMQAAGTPGLEDEDIRNNLIGLMIGAVPTLSKAACLAMEELMRRPEQLRKAAKAAKDGDDDLLARMCWEALRFNPHQPLIYRRAVRDVTLARSTLREKRIPKGTMVFALTISAAFDPLSVPDANEFRTDRPRDVYMTWGYGLHNCFGEAINLAVIPAILKPVLKLPGLRYAQGASGIDTEGTRFPVHMRFAYDAEGARAA